MSWLQGMQLLILHDSHSKSHIKVKQFGENMFHWKNFTKLLLYWLQIENNAPPFTDMHSLQNKFRFLGQSI
jgi:hypothetical protein